MKPFVLTPTYALLAATLLNPDMARSQEAISLHPGNPHYFVYQGKPTILITSAEHYGAVINLDFDYKTYLEELKSTGLNLTRTFTGAYVEPQGAFNIAENTLAPAAGRFIAPWLRSSEPGYKGGGNKFDLSRWDDRYFNRLRDFVSSARQEGVIVELALFCPFYEEVQWSLSPMNSANNINGVGTVRREDVYTLDKNGGLLAIHDALVRKIVTELKGYPNLIYEICNEPYFGGVTMDWQHHIADVISETEQGLGVKHLISQNIANGSARINNPHPDVSVFNFHYASPPVAVAQNYHLNKVIGDNETGFDGTSDSTYRIEGWAFILAGGGLYNNLDYSFTANHEKGTYAYPSTQPGGGSKALRQQLGFLLDFMEGCDFISMKPDSAIVGGLLPGVKAQTLAEKGKHYAAYLHGPGQKEISLDIPAGTYEIEWMDPVSGKYTKGTTIKYKGGTGRIPVPPYDYDVAVRLRNKSE